MKVYKKNIIVLFLCMAQVGVSWCSPGVDALFRAANAGRTDEIQSLLLQHTGMDVNIRDEGGFTILMAAAKHGHKDLVEQLLRQGANINAQNTSGCTALMCAAQQGDESVIEQLISAGVDLKAVDCVGNNALMYALAANQRRAIQQLIGFGFDVNVRNNAGATPLVCAATKGLAEVVRVLLDAGANIEIKTKMGWTALTWAKMMRHSSIVAMLQSAGAQEVSVPRFFRGSNKRSRDVPTDQEGDSMRTGSGLMGKGAAKSSKKQRIGGGVPELGVAFKKLNLEERLT